MIEIQDLSVHFTTKSKEWFKKNIIKAVENASLTIEENTTVGLVGESGCGKSTLGRAILKLLPLHSGKIFYQNQEITHLKPSEFLKYRKELQMIFQDPYSSLNPRFTVFEIVTEGLLTHYKLSKEKAKEKAVQVLEKVGLKSEILYRYPHEFSGGQRQRIAIARVLVLEPRFVVCDEITSALDVSNQAQVINLIKEYKSKNPLSLLFISHDLNIISYIADVIAVMYLGKIVEIAKRDEIVEKPLHPYTKALFSNVFEVGEFQRKKEVLQGEVPGVIHKPKGCYFHTRCPLAQELCKQESPAMRKIGNSRFVACHLVEIT